MCTTQTQRENRMNPKTFVFEGIGNNAVFTIVAMDKAEAIKMVASQAAAAGVYMYHLVSVDGVPV